MKLGNIVKTAIKYGPIIYPIIKKMLDKKNTTPTSTQKQPRK